VVERVTHEDVMRYLDGEASPELRERIQREVETSTELHREVTIFKHLRDELRQLNLPGAILAGSAIWLGYGTYAYVTSPIDWWEKTATGAIVIGIMLLLASVILEQYRQWLIDPYRDVQR
jgi:hypothetical protein